MLIHPFENAALFEILKCRKWEISSPCATNGFRKGNKYIYNKYITSIYIYILYILYIHIYVYIYILNP